MAVVVAGVRGVGVCEGGRVCVCVGGGEEGEGWRRGGVWWVSVFGSKGGRLLVIQHRFGGQQVLYY